MVRGILKSVANDARALLQDVHCIRSLFRGARGFAKTGVTSDEAYQSLIRLHCRTNGRSNDLLHQYVKLKRGCWRLPPADGVLGSLGSHEVRRAVAEIRRKGYLIFPQRLPEVICDRLTQFALTSEANTSPPRDVCPGRAVYDRERPVAEAYKFDEQVLVNNADIQRLIADASLQQFAQEYLQSGPLQSIVAMWWSTAARFSTSAQTELAQMFHFDMDRIKWIKFFFYLTDVTRENGAHCFVAGSHRRGGQPRELLRRGYVRIPDDDLRRHYPPEAIVEITGPRGTIFAADTRGFHKGLVPQRGDRLMLQLEFCDSLFGGSYGRPEFPMDCDPTLRQNAHDFPNMYQRFRKAAPPAGR